MIAGSAQIAADARAITSAASKARQVLLPTATRVSTGASTGAICSNPSEHPPLSTIIVLPRESTAHRWNWVRPASCSARCNNVIRVSPTPNRMIAPSISPSARSGACTAAPCCPSIRSVASGPIALKDASGWSPRRRSGRASTTRGIAPMLRSMAFDAVEKAPWYTGGATFIE